jgi:kumamolisin
LLALPAGALSTVRTVGAVLVADVCSSPAPTAPDVISGPFASLLASSRDLGPARTDHVQLTAALRDPSRPGRLIGWAQQQGLSVRWRPGDDCPGEVEGVNGGLDM